MHHSSFRYQMVSDLGPAMWDARFVKYLTYCCEIVPVVINMFDFTLLCMSFARVSLFEHVILFLGQLRK